MLAAVVLVQAVLAAPAMAVVQVLLESLSLVLVLVGRKAEEPELQGLAVLVAVHRQLVAVL